MASCTVVMNGNNRVFISLNHTAYCIGRALLHFRVCALHRVEFYPAAELTGICRRYSRATHSYTVILTTQYHYFVSFFRYIFNCLVGLAISYPACEHDHFVKGHKPVVLFVLKGEYRTRDQWLAKFISKI